MLTGVKPRIAATLAQMDLDLRGIRTLGSLQEASPRRSTSGEHEKGDSQGRSLLRGSVAKWGSGAGARDALAR